MQHPSPPIHNPLLSKTLPLRGHYNNIDQWSISYIYLSIENDGQHCFGPRILYELQQLFYNFTSLSNRILRAFSKLGPLYPFEASLIVFTICCQYDEQTTLKANLFAQRHLANLSRHILKCYFQQSLWSIMCKGHELFFRCGQKWVALYRLKIRRWWRGLHSLGSFL